MPALAFAAVGRLLIKEEHNAIMVHQYHLNGYHIVLDTCSGSVHAVDEVAYDMIDLYQKHIIKQEPLPVAASDARAYILSALAERYQDKPDVSRQELEECLEDIETLRQEGKLFTPDAYEHLALDYKNNSKVIKALCLHVAHTCNLNCSYCFASQGNYHGERELMSFETGKQALDFLIAHSGGRTNLEVDFFGGEPLMNWQVVKQLVAYARSQEPIHHKKFRFTLTTNGVCLDDEVIEFANREMHNVVLSLDGRKEVHDRFRVTHSGQGSYDKIVPKFQELVRRRCSDQENPTGNKSYYMRGTFTHYNTDFTKDILHMADLGFRELSMEPVVCSPSEPQALTEEDLPILFAQYELLAKEMIQRQKEGRGFTFYHYILDLKHGPCIYKRVSGCGSGTEYMAVTPSGELFPCHQFVGDPRYSLGNIWDGVTNPAVQDEFRSCNAYSRPECKDCWAQLYCAGGCAANAYHASGTVQGIYDYGCRLFRKRMECAVMVQVALGLEAGFSAYGGSL